MALQIKVSRMVVGLSSREEVGEGGSVQREVQGSFVYFPPLKRVNNWLAAGSAA